MNDPVIIGARRPIRPAQITPSERGIIQGLGQKNIIGVGMSTTTLNLTEYDNGQPNVLLDTTQDPQRRQAFMEDVKRQGSFAPSIFTTNVPFSELGSPGIRAGVPALSQSLVTTSMTRKISGNNSTKNAAVKDPQREFFEMTVLSFQLCNPKSRCILTLDRAELY